MAPLPSVTKTLKLDLHYNVGADTAALTRLHFAYTGSAPPAADCTTIATAARTAFNTWLKTLMSPNRALEQVVVTDLDSSTGAEGIDNTAVTGTRTGGEIPAGAAVLVNYKVAQRYRGGKPRSYFPFATATDMNGPSAWQGSFTAACDTGVNGFIGALIPLTVGSTTIATFVATSYYHNKALRATPVNFPIISVKTNSRPGSQRRRNLH